MVEILNPHGIILWWHHPAVVDPVTGVSKELVRYESRQRAWCRLEGQAESEKPRGSVPLAAQHVPAYFHERDATNNSERSSASRSPVAGSS
jgi:hypothetical protein